MVKIFSFKFLGEYIYGPSSQEAAATIAQLTKTFCREYKINQEALVAGKSGIVIGRYPGDHYAGGNPWQLLTAVLGETFYLGATATLKKIASCSIGKNLISKHILFSLRVVSSVCSEE